MKRVCVVHNNVDQTTSIGKLASWAVTTALSAGLEVTVVAKDLDPGLKQDVMWRRLCVPPRIHAFQWAVARRTVLNALHGVECDALHVFQPQLAALADTWHVQYLSRVAIDAGSLAVGSDLRTRSSRGQQRAVARMEDHYLRSVGQRPTLLFCSPLMERHFIRLYGTPAHRGVLVNPAFIHPSFQAAVSRAAARRSFGLSERAFVIGYLGGVDERKGYRELIHALNGLPEDTVLLMAGPGSEGYTSPDLGARLESLGMLTALSEFWAAVDVLAVPSRFDPFGMVVTEAASAGVPVVVTPSTGAADFVHAHRAGEVVGHSEFADGLLRVRANVDAYATGLQSLAASVSAESQSTQLLEEWATAARRNRGASHLGLTEGR